MIKKTKNQMNNFALDVHKLKKNVSELNVDFRQVGFGVNDDVFYDLEKKMYPDLVNNG